MSELEPPPPSRIEAVRQIGVVTGALLLLVPFIVGVVAAVVAPQLWLAMVAIVSAAVGVGVVAGRSVVKPAWLRRTATRSPTLREIRAYERSMGWWHALALLLFACSAFAVGADATGGVLETIEHKSLDAADTAQVLTAVCGLITASCLGAAAVIKALAVHLKARTDMAKVLVGILLAEETEAARQDDDVDFEVEEYRRALELKRRQERQERGQR